jgi:prophage regulatory protein
VHSITSDGEQHLIKSKHAHQGATPIIRKPRVRELTGYSETQIWRLEKRGMFPSRIQLGVMAVGWYEDEVLEWLRTRARGMGKQPPLPKARRQAEAAAG